MNKTTVEKMKKTDECSMLNAQVSMNAQCSSINETALPVEHCSLNIENSGGSF